MHRYLRDSTLVTTYTASTLVGHRFSFASEKGSIVLDTHIQEAQDRYAVSPIGARLPLRKSECIVFESQAPHRALRGEYLLGCLLTHAWGANFLFDVQDRTRKTAAIPDRASQSRFAAGKMVEDWVNWDALGLIQQLEVVPEIAKAKAAAR